MCNTPPHSKYTKKNERIEYIDALRGFAIMLVVMMHVSNFCLGAAYRVFTYQTVIFEFVMPSFFFISGFVFYKGINLDRFKTLSFLKKKILTLIITPTILLCIYLCIYKIPLVDAVCMESKAGYWFTFVLFGCFCFYILLSFILQYEYGNIVIGLVSLGCYICTSSAMLERMALDETIRGVLSIGYWGYFFFFWMGTCVKERFAQFQKLLDANWLMPLSIVLFISCNVFHGICKIHTLRTLLCQSTGLFIVFGFFRYYQQSFTRQTKIGATLQYIGRRTLDIYLLHYFFLPVNLKNLFPYFFQTSLPALELVVSLLIAGVVIVLCLIVGGVLRINPEMAHLMWGAKRIGK